MRRAVEHCRLSRSAQLLGWSQLDNGRWSQIGVYALRCPLGHVVLWASKPDHEGEENPECETCFPDWE